MCASMSRSPWDAAKLHSAWRLARRHLLRTPLLRSQGLSAVAGRPVWLKCEHRQKTGSFKVRGAINALAGLSREELRRGVSTVSAGNHALAVAWASKRAGTRAVVVMPESASRFKVEGTRRLGAEVVLSGDAAHAFGEVRRISEERGLTFLHPFDSKPVIYGHATCGREVFEELPETGTVAAPVGGGGLLAGLAVAAELDKREGRRASLWGVEPEGAAAMSASLAVGRPVSIESPDTIADGLAAPMAGELTWRVVKDSTRGVALVSDEEIVAALVFLLEREELAVEPSGAAAVAALLAGRIDIARDGPVVLVLTGGNIDPQVLAGYATGEHVSLEAPA